MAVLSNLSMATKSSCLTYFLLNIIFLLTYWRKVRYRIFDFTGDNFYDNGLKSVNDTLFEESFVNIYTAPSLQNKWYNGITILQQLDSRWVCLRSYVLDAEIVDFFFVDTTPFVDKYFTEPGEHTMTGVAYHHERFTSTKCLKESNAKWKIVVGHHPVRTHLRENNVDLYINGHDHCLQHISSTKRKVKHLKRGFGILSTSVPFVQKEKEGLEFYHDGQGFITYYDVSGYVMYHLVMYKDQQLHSLTQVENRCECT
ncbi:hypothetical protein MKX01_033534 [Papaver californicum]|nr:hypothetical protein MKX01_033534 [Papaver californicum]